jgi:hypothetical protein
MRVAGSDERFERANGMFRRISETLILCGVRWGGAVHTFKRGATQGEGGPLAAAEVESRLGAARIGFASRCVTAPTRRRT